MNRTFLFPVVILCLLISGCSPKSINSNQAFQQTCNANPVNNNESQEKQCCLKDSLETRIKHIEEICILKEYKLSKDSVCNASSSSSYIAASSSFTAIPTRNTKIHGQLDYKSKEVADMRQGCFGANCQVNTIQIENKNDISKLFLDIYKLLKGYLIDEDYLIIILSILGLSIILGISLVFPNLIKKEFLKKIIFLKEVFSIIEENKTEKFFTLLAKLSSYKSNPYNILSPTDEASISYETLSQLKFAIIDDKSKIRNIAITGSYGSGKSSVWKTFCRKYSIPKIKNIVEISLAKFNEPNEKKFPTTINDELEIEKAIIQQLIYSRKNIDLKYSNFSKINNLTDLKTIGPASFLFILVALVSAIANNTIYFTIDSWLKAPLQLDRIYVPILLFSLYILIFFGIQRFNKLRISKICLKEIEITLGSNESLFNKYINEIVYFFEATKCNCVVIEDLDRFNSLKIFTKLREINTLINNYPPTKNKVKFIYLVKDELLSSDDQTKFFDFIIPIIPVLNIHNYKDRITENANNLHFSLSPSFLKDIHDYLLDFRFVKNCINESLIYKHRKKHISDYDNDYILNQKIYSLVLYKKLYPIDFCALLQGKGVLFNSINEFYRNRGSLKNISKDETRISLREYIKTQKINSKEDINIELIVLLLTNGYIDDNYQELISISKAPIFTYEENTYLFNIQNDLPESIHIHLQEKHLNMIRDRVKNYQWNSPGVLNNQMIDYILNDKTNKTQNFGIMVKIVEAMYSYDKKQPDPFIPKYFNHCQKNNIETDIILKAIAKFISSSDNLKKADKILSCFFKKNNTNLFFDFLQKNISTPSKETIKKPIFAFLNSEPPFTNLFFRDNIINTNFVNTLEKYNIQINLSTELCNMLDKYDLFSKNIYKINKTNVNLILEYKKYDTNIFHYLTHCLSINGLNERINKCIPEFYNNILSTLKNIEEDYTTTKFVFSHPKLSNINKQHILSNSVITWEVIILYSYFVSTDDVLADIITKNFDKIDINKNSPIWNDLNIIKAFIRAIIAYPNFSNKDLNDKYLSFWGKYISILNCFDNDNDAINQLSLERNHLLQEYAITHEKDKLNNTMVNLIINDPQFFEKIYPEKEYSVESEFQLLILEDKSNQLTKIQKKYIDKVNSCPDPDSESRKFKAYKKNALQLYPISDSDRNNIEKSIKQIKPVLYNLQHIDLNKIDDNTPREAFKIQFFLKNNLSTTNNHWIELLIDKTVSYSLNLTTLLLQETDEWKKDSQKNNQDLDDNNLKQNHHLLCQKIEAMIRELEDYISPSK